MNAYHSFFFAAFFFAGTIIAAVDPLPAWNEGPAKESIIQFVRNAGTEGGQGYIPVKDRIAVFDEDGTLWVEQPLYVEFFFALDSIKAQAANHPEWKDNEPFRTLLEEGIEAVKKFDMKEIVEVIAATHSGMTIEEFHQRVADWLKTAVHPRFKKPFTELVYQPMQEVMHLFKDNQFQIYIVSGGGQEFMRSFAENLYGVEPGHVIGTAGKVRYELRDGAPALYKLPEILFIDDKQGKPEGINLIIGKRPLAAFGNSIGDRQMLEWTQGKWPQGKKGETLQYLVHHDDPVREYAYGPDSKIGTFSDSLAEEAKMRGWTVVSMKNDWKTIFPWQRETDKR